MDIPGQSRKRRELQGPFGECPGSQGWFTPNNTVYYRTDSNIRIYTKSQLPLDNDCTRGLSVKDASDNALSIYSVGFDQDGNYMFKLSPLSSSYVGVIKASNNVGSSTGWMYLESTFSGDL